MAGKMASLFCILACSLLLVSSASAKLEEPEYTLLHVANDYEVRIYPETVWATAAVEDISFARATTLGFNSLFQYISGDNVNKTKIEMSAPVWTGIVPSSGPFCSSAFEVRFFMPEEFRDAPPAPLEDSGVEIKRVGKQLLAVRFFSGYAMDSNVAQEAEQLAITLSNSEFTKNATFPLSGSDSYGIAQYNSPFQFWDRRNEVWVGISIPGYDLSAKEDH